MDDIIVLPNPGIDLHPSFLSKEGLIENLNLMNPVPKMKAKRTTKKVKMPKAKTEKKMKTHKIKSLKAPTEGGKIKEKHVHAHHPPWADMMCAAVKCLNEKHGSSMPAIKKYILSHYNIDIETNRITPMLKRGLKAAMESKKLRQVKGHGLAGSFKLDVLGMKKGKIVKRIKNKKLVKKGTKAGGKKIMKKEKKMVKKTGTKKISKTKKITPNAGLLKPGMGKIKKMKKPKSESKKELKIKKISKTPMKMKGKSAKQAKARKAPMPKKVVLTSPNPPLLGDITGMPVIMFA